MKTILRSFAIAVVGITCAVGCKHSHSHSSAGECCGKDGECCKPAETSSIYICPPGCVHPCASEKVARLPECDCK